MIEEKEASLLWVDLEMTGLDPVQDRILEIAAIATDWNFETLATYEAVVKVGPALAKKRMTCEFWDENATTRDALLTQNLEKGRSARTVENALLQFLDAHFNASKSIYLAGNSIHQDRRFIAHEWPRLDARLHYRMLDVSAWKIVFENKFRRKFTKPETHRALADIQGSIEELQFYLKKVKD